MKRIIYLISLMVWAVLSLEERNQIDRITRKRIDAENNDGRRYLEALWESVETKSEKDLEPGRFRFLESMMSIAMSFPTKAPKPSTPTRQPALSPNTPTENPLPTPNRPNPPSIPISLPTTRGPTLPTRVPLPTNPPAVVIPPTSKPFDENPAAPILGPTNFPAVPCSEDRKNDCLLNLLSTVTDLSLLLDKDTPQGLAYSFLLNEEPSFVGTPTIMQRYGLSTFYFSTGGSEWTENEGWLSSTQECEWFGVVCTDDLFATGLNLGKKGGNLPLSYARILYINYCVLHQSNI